MAEQLVLRLPSPVPNLVQLWTPAEIYDRLDGGNIHQFGEDRRFERKSAKIGARALSECLSMWANTSPHGGLVVVGVENDGTISGCKSSSTGHLNSLVSLSDFCPDARYTSRNVAVINAKGEEDFVLLSYVPYRADKVVETTAGDAFVREGEKKICLSEIVKRELRIAKGEIHHELERVHLVFPQDFDLEEIDKFCKVYSEARKFPTKKSRDEMLELAVLGKRVNKDFQPNLACALMFAKDPRQVAPGARIRVIRYDGTYETFGTEMNAVFSAFVDGNVAKILFEVRPIIEAQLRSFERYDGAGRIVKHPEYPEEAWFEAIVNAVAHRSYNLRTQNIFVKIYDDKFVVESPGGFVPPTTATTIYDAHNPRNPYLMEAMMHLDLTFCAFEGTRRMRRAMQRVGLPEPKFHQIEANAYQVRATLENNIISRRATAARPTFEGLSETDFFSLSPDERAIVGFLQTSATINVTSASLVTGKSWPTCQKLMSALVERGILVPTSDRRRKHDSTKAYRLQSGSRTPD